MDGITTLYLPNYGEDEQDMGIFLDYGWDKYIFDDNLECKFDYHGDFAALEGVIWNIKKEVPGEVCAYIFFFEAANCGNGCLPEDTWIGMYTFIEQVPKRDRWLNLWNAFKWQMAMLFFLPVGYFNAMIGDFNSYYADVAFYGEEIAPIYTQTYKHYFNDDELNKQIQLRDYS